MGNVSKAKKVKALLKAEPKRAALLLQKVYLDEDFCRTRVAQRVGCAPQTLKRWEQAYPALGAAVQRAKTTWLKELERM